jgi:O-antigen/teichoic acid export membrane protein
MSLLSRIRARLPRDIGSLAGSNLASQLCSLGATPLLTRWCSLADFGSYQIYATVMMVAGLVACARFDWAILAPTDHPRAKRLCVLAVAVALVSGALMALGVDLCASLLPTSGWTAIASHPLFIGATVAVTGVNAAVSQWRVRTGNFPVIARARVTQSVATAVMQLAGAYSGLGGLALIFGDAAGRAASLAVLAFPRKWRAAAASAFTLSDLPELASDYIHFPAISTPSALVNAAGFSIPIFLLQRFCGPQAVGLYSLLDRVMNLPATLLGQPLSQIFTHRLREAAGRCGSAAAAEILSTVRTAAFFGTIPYGLLLIAGPALFSFVFGSKWHAAGLLSQLLALPYFVTFVFSPVMPTLIMLNQLRTQLLWDITRAAGMFSALWLLGSLGVASNAMISSIAIVMAAMYCFHFSLCLRAARRL